MCVCVQERQLGKERISSIRCTNHLHVFSIFLLTVHWFVSICFSVPLQVVWCWFGLVLFVASGYFQRKQGICWNLRKKWKKNRVEYTICFYIKGKQKAHIQGKKNKLSVLCSLFFLLYPLDYFLEDIYQILFHVLIKLFFLPLISDRSIWIL